VTGLPAEGNDRDVATLISCIVTFVVTQFLLFLVHLIDYKGNLLELILIDGSIVFQNLWL